MTKSSVGVIAAATVAVLLVLAGAGWWYHTSRPENRYKAGYEAARAGDIPRAVRQAEALEENGQTELALLVRAEIELQQGEALRALTFALKIQTEGEVQIRAAYLAAQCYIALKNLREAERALLSVTGQEPDHIDAHRLLAGIYYDQGDFRLARPQLEQVAVLVPTDERPHFLIGLMEKDMDRPTEAVAAFQESRRRNPNGPKAEETRLELGEVQIKIFQYTDALATLGDLDSPRAIALRAEAMVGDGKGADAVPLLDAALATSPNHIELLKQRALIYRNSGDNANAAKLLERAVAIDKHDFRARTQLALCYGALGEKTKQAEQQKLVKETQDLIAKLNLLNQSAMTDPWDPVVRERLAGLCDQLNKPKLAEMWREAARACRPTRAMPSMGGR